LDWAVKPPAVNAVAVAAIAHRAYLVAPRMGTS
jgi:hypothetical protein